MMQRRPNLRNNTGAARNISARRAVYTSFTVDIVDIIINSAAAFITGSVVMFVEALHGVSDVVADIFLIVGLKRAKRPVDKRHPFGYGRELYVWAMFSAVAMLVLLAGVSIYTGWKRFINPEPVEYIALAYAILGISIFTNGYAFSVSFRRLLKNGSAARRGIWRTFISSPLIETKTTFVFDLVGAMAAVFGMTALVLFGITGNLRFDGLGAMAIGGMMAVLALLLIAGVKELLVGRRASPEVERKVMQAALAVPEVQEVLDIRTVHIGLDRLLVNMEVHLQEEMHTEEIEVVIDRIKERVRSDVPSVYHIQVELETPEEE